MEWLNCRSSFLIIMPIPYRLKTYADSKPGKQTTIQVSEHFIPEQKDIDALERRLTNAMAKLPSAHNMIVINARLDRTENEIQEQNKFIEKLTEENEQLKLRLLSLSNSEPVKHNFWQRLRGHNGSN